MLSSLLHVKATRFKPSCVARTNCYSRRLMHTAPVGFAVLMAIFVHTGRAVSQKLRLHLGAKHDAGPGVNMATTPLLCHLVSQLDASFGREERRIEAQERIFVNQLID